jgi:hypothetical protein
MRRGGAETERCRRVPTEAAFVFTLTACSFSEVVHLLHVVSEVSSQSLNQSVGMHQLHITANRSVLHGHASSNPVTRVAKKTEEALFTGRTRDDPMLIPGTPYSLPKASC